MIQLEERRQGKRSSLRSFFGLALHCVSLMDKLCVLQVIGNLLVIEWSK